MSNERIAEAERPSVTQMTAAFTAIADQYPMMLHLLVERMIALGASAPDAALAISKLLDQVEETHRLEHRALMHALQVRRQQHQQKTAILNFLKR